jgi:protein-L-isoaspartate(D-aspartate) O-methyltransferase
MHALSFDKLKPITGYLIGLFFLIFATITHAKIDVDSYANKRHALIKTIENDVKLTRQYLDKSTLNPKVLGAMKNIPRHKFVPKNQQYRAYDNTPLPIGYGQTISQPYIVAVMTDLLNLSPSDKVLEIGTGSGYQAAVLSKLVKHVYSIEIIKPLSLKANQALKQLGYENIKLKVGDGYYGWKENAPFDAIIVTAAASHIPPSLLDQLKKGGVMIIPVGSRFMVQQLLLIKKNHQGKYEVKQILPVRFVPLTRAH